MTPLDLNQLPDNIRKTQNWSKHRKSMYSMNVLHELSIADGATRRMSDEHIIPASDRPLTVQIVNDVLDQLIEYGEIDVMNVAVNPHLLSDSGLTFPHVLIFNETPGIQYILDTHIWLKVMNDAQRTLALVVTGNKTGHFTFNIENSDGIFENIEFSFHKNGIYQLTGLSERILHLQNEALVLN
jgi:hypothetical protein